MQRSAFRLVESEEEFVALLREHDLFREDDVVFDDLAVDNNYVYVGDDFEVDPEMLEEMGIGGLLIIGSVRVDSLRVSDILGDAGVFCVTGNLSCRDMLYMTEMTGVGVGGNLVVENAFYADCGNSGLQVNGNLSARILFNFQCEIDVRGEETSEYDESATLEELQSLGIPTTETNTPNDAMQRYFKVGNYG